MSLYLNCVISNLITHKLVREQIFLLGPSLFIKQINMDKFFIKSNPNMIGLVHLYSYSTFTSYLSAWQQTAPYPSLRIN